MKTYLKFRLCKSLFTAPLVIAALCPTALIAANEYKILSYGLVEVKSVDPSIKIDLPYARINNFTGKQLYPKPLCFLQLEAAKALSAAQSELKAHGYGLVIWDGYRPISIRKELEDSTINDYHFTQPKQSTQHAKGTAVCVSLVDSQGFELDMPTPFDIFTEKAHRDYQNLSEDVLFNRTLLEQVMIRHNFTPHPGLWWHFDYIGHEKYPELDISLHTLIDEYEASREI